MAELRPLYLPPDPAGRTAYEAGVIGQCDFWFPDIRVPIGFGQFRMAKTLPVLTMVTGYSRWASAVLIPSRTAEDLYAGWWQHISALGACPRVLVWDGVGVRSGRSAVPVFRPVRFCGPPPEPDVRLVDASGSPQAPEGVRVMRHSVLGHGEGILVPR